MHFLNTHTLELETHASPNEVRSGFSGDRRIRYAIVSHRWLGDEVSFAEYRSLFLEHVSADAKQTLRERSGYIKIVNACKQAREDDLKYLWIDTCCIDKSSSAELSETINSMAEWYKQSEVCYAYLADVHMRVAGQSFHEGRRSMSFSEYFDRGWTLQELIFATDLRFYDATWNLLGSKLQFDNDLSVRTGIDCAVLRDHKYLQYVCVAKKLSWARHRTTTRAEDASYCLMGLFGVHMPLIYGEGGANAFARLQEAIIRAGCDQSVLIWYHLGTRIRRAVFAPRLFDFVGDGKWISLSGAQPESLELVPSGVRLTVPTIEDGKYLLAVLACGDEDDPKGPIAMRLRRSQYHVLDNEKGTPESPIHAYRLRIARFTWTPIVPSPVFPIVALEELKTAQVKTLIISGYGEEDDLGLPKRIPRASLWLRASSAFARIFALESVDGSGTWIERTKTVRLLLSPQTAVNTFTWRSQGRSKSMNLVVHCRSVEERKSVFVPAAEAVPGDYGGCFELAFDGDTDTENVLYSSNEPVLPQDEDSLSRIPSSAVIDVCGVHGRHDVRMVVNIEWRMDALVCIIDIGLNHELQDVSQVRNASEQHNDKHIEVKARCSGVRLAYRPHSAYNIFSSLKYGSEFIEWSDDEFGSELGGFEQDSVEDSDQGSNKHAEHSALETESVKRCEGTPTN